MSNREKACIHEWVKRGYTRKGPWEACRFCRIWRVFNLSKWEEVQLTGSAERNVIKHLRNYEAVSR